VLFVDVPKIKVEVSHRGLTGIAHSFDILDDCGTEKRQATQLSLTKGNCSTNQSILLPEPATNKDRYEVASGSGMGQGHTFSMNPE